MNTQSFGPQAFLWQPLFEAVAQTMIGVVSTYAITKIASKVFQHHSYEGAMDLWHRGIRQANLQEGDTLRFDGLISPFCQLFPGDPFDNSRKWNSLYDFPGKITSSEYQAMDFFAGADAALRVGSINGETLVGLYARYGYVGEGIVGVAPTKLIQRRIPDFFHPAFVGTRARITGKLSRCPSQHGFVAMSIARRARIPMSLKEYSNTWYIQIRSIDPLKNEAQNTYSLLGSAWAATSNKDEQYLVQYGYLQNSSERQACIDTLSTSTSWKRARVFYDDIDCPSERLSFRRNFM